MKALVTGLICTLCMSLGVFESTSQTRSLTPYDTIPNKKLIVRDESQYSKSFIKAMHQFLSDSRYYDEAELIDSLIYFKGRNKPPIHFPSFPKINQNYLLKTTVGKSYYELELRRKNYSDVEFHLILRNDLETIFDRKGVLILNPIFIQAGEAYEDEISRYSYVVFHYSSDKDVNNCLVSISISSFLFENQLKAVIEKISCSDSSMQRMIEKRPTLRSK